VTLRANASLGRVALVVGDALRRRGIRAVLTGGACSSIYTDGAYASIDVDFILASEIRQRDLDEAMAAVGFSRSGDRYVHPKLRFFVEFPRGPLGIGGDVAIRPVLLRRASLTTRALSPTDACRDRLAAFYHWNDRQSLSVAVEIACRHKIDMKLVEKWSSEEGSRAGFQTFLRRLSVTGATRKRPRRPTSRS
jgi:hypothetical protein